MINTMEGFLKALREDPDDDHTRLVFADYLSDHGQEELSEQVRRGNLLLLISKGYKSLFDRSIIAQDDDNDYDEAGWVCVRIGDWCALARYSHCSCYDTWASITGGGISDSEGPNDPAWDWQGAYKDLLVMATERRDPTIPDRIADPQDHDYDHLMKVYEQVINNEYGAGT